MGDEVNEGRWLIEPPGPGEIHLAIESGEGAEVSPEAHAALGKLIDLLFGDDTAGFASKPQCVPFTCNGNGPCVEFSVTACVANTSCRIAQFF
jgi:hypothetical protein